MKIELDIIDSMIFSKMKRYVMDEIGAKYNLTDDNFSTVKDNPSDADFPFVSMSLISATETSNDLEATTLRGGLFTYQINVFDNQSQARTKEIMNYVTKAMKSMSFRATSLPLFANNGSTFVQVARWQRNFDEGDEL